MNKINFIKNSINYSAKQKKAQKQSFCANQVVNYAPMPVYTQVPYGINQRNYIKLGVDKLPNGQEIHLYRLVNGQNVQIIKKDGGEFRHLLVLLLINSAPKHVKIFNRLCHRHFKVKHQIICLVAGNGIQNSVV